jgi:hypothetical protein
MEFSASGYGAEIERILGEDGAGLRLMPLAPAACSSEDVRKELKRHKARDLFPNAASPEGALAGLFLYFSCLDEAHSIAQELNTAEGSFWHGIMHRQEPDPDNAKYWFRRVGKHSVFPALRREASQTGFDTGAEWDPYRFIDFCEAARKRPGSRDEEIALRVQRTEWQLLFDYCAREKASR